APIHAGQLLEAAHAEIGQVRRNIRHPAEIAGRSTDATRRPGAAAVYVVEAAEKSGDGLGCAVERHVDIAVAGDFAAWRLRRQRVSRLVPEEPLVLLAPFHWEVGNLGLCLCRRCRSLRCAGFGLRRLGLRFARLSLGGRSVGVALLLFGLEVL